jgi:hypothetical protein
MLPNKTILDKLHNFAVKSITFEEFQTMLEATSIGNPIRIHWFKLDGTKADRLMYWDSGAYSPDNKATITREEEGLQALLSLSDGDDWRTIDYNTVWKCRFNDQTFYVK